MCIKLLNTIQEGKVGMRELVAVYSCVTCHDLNVSIMAGSSMRLVTLKPQGPAPIGARTAQCKKILERNFAVL